MTVTNPSSRSQPLQIEDFSGGITDNYVDAAPNKAKTCDNFLVTPNKKLLSRPGSILFDAVNYQTPNGNNRVNSLINFVNDSDLLVGSYRDIFYIDGTWQKILGPTGNTVFNAGDFPTQISFAQWRKHLFLANDEFATVQKIFRDQNGDYQLRTAGLPKLASNPVITPGAAGANNFIYAFCYQYTYNVETVEFQDFGAITQVLLSNSGDPSLNTNVISAIPVITNGATQNYDTANIKVKIFRTINNGTTLFEIGEVTNGTTTFNDTFADSAISLLPTAYTEGGVVNNDPPPSARLLHIVNSVGYYGDIKEGTERIKARLRQSVADDIDSCPETFFLDLDEDIKGVSSVRGIPVVLCEKSIYRIDGQFDERGQGGMVSQRINDTAGCVSHRSIVQTIDGIFWAGNDGFYYSDGYRVQKISNDFNNTYKVLIQTDVQKGNIVGVYDEENNRIWWSVQKDGGSLDNDSCFVLDLRWGIRQDSTFTTISGGLSFQPTALCFYRGQLLRGEKTGYVLKHDEEYFTDPKIDVFSLPSVWGVQTIIWDYESVAFNFGTAFVRKWVPKISVNAKNLSNLSLQIISNNDDNRIVAKLSPIRFRGNIFWGDIELEWGDPDIVWNKDGIIDQIRYFPSGSMRCDYKQIRLTNAYVVVTSSDTLGTADLIDPVGPGIDPSVRYLDLNNTTDFEWPEDSVDYYVSFPDDEYTLEYYIRKRTNDDRIEFTDSEGTSIAGTGKQWVIRGYPKKEVFFLNSYVVHHSMQTDSQRNYRGSDTGEVGSSS